MTKFQIAGVVGELKPGNPVTYSSAVTKEVNPAEVFEILPYTPGTSGVTGGVTQITIINRSGNALVPQAYISSTATATLATAWSSALA